MMDEYYGICRFCSELSMRQQRAASSVVFGGFDQVPRKKRCKGFKENLHHDIDD
jgi:hypothetical protein